jgi:hypothetical protein
MAMKRPAANQSLRQAQRKRRLPYGPRRVLHITLPLATAKRLERIVLERDAASASVVVCDLVERCPIRAGGDGPVEPAEPA